MRGYAQLDMAHKGDMWNNINPNDKNTGLPRFLQALPRTLDSGRRGSIWAYLCPPPAT